jgi:hypothetical protein
MEYDAFNSGVNPGGLINSKQIKLLVCYILKSIGKPIGKQSLTELLQYEGLANYFEVIKAIDDLTELGNIAPSDEGGDKYIITEQGIKNAEELFDSMLPESVKQKAVSAATRTLAHTRRMEENLVEIEKASGGYNVICRSLDGERTLIKIELLVPDLIQAEAVKNTFLSNPLKIYSGSIALLTGDFDAVKAQFESKE